MFELCKAYFRNQALVTAKSHFMRMFGGKCKLKPTEKGSFYVSHSPPIKKTPLTLLLIRMLARKACFSDEDRRFKIVCPFLLLGFKRLFHRVGFVGQSESE